MKNKYTNKIKYAATALFIALFVSAQAPISVSAYYSDLPYNFNSQYYGSGGLQSNSCFINSFYASPSTVQPGGTTTLSWWASTGCKSISLAGGNISNQYLANNGSMSTNAITNTTTFALIARDTYGQGMTNTVIVYVSNQNPVSACTISSFYASPNTVSPGEETTLYWTTTNASNASLSPFGPVPNTGSKVVSPTQGNSTYALTGNCINGGYTATQTLTVPISQQTTTVVATTNTTTMPATVITQTSVKLNGSVNNLTSQLTAGGFEWGETAALGKMTPSQNIGSDATISFSDTVTGLSPNTYYYYRAVTNTTVNGAQRGNILSFKTAGVPSTTSVVTTKSTTPARVVVATTQGTGSDLTALSIDNNSDNICPADGVMYTVKYKNVSTKKLSDAVLRVTLPESVDFVPGGLGTYSQDNRVVTVILTSLVPDQEGAVFIQGKVNNKITSDPNSLVVTTASLLFTYDENNTQGETIAYALNHESNCATNSLVGLSLFAGGFWPKTFIGWLSLLLLILLTIYLARKFYTTSQQKAATPHYDH